MGAISTGWTQKACCSVAATVPPYIVQEAQRLSKLLEQVDSDRQSLQREKAEMVGELVLLREAAATAPTVAAAAQDPTAESEAVAAAPEAQQTQQELERQLAEAKAALAESQQTAQAWWEHAQYWESAAQQAQQQQGAAAGEAQPAGEPVAGVLAATEGGPDSSLELEGLRGELAAWQARCGELEARCLELEEAAASGSGVAGGAPDAQLERLHAELAEFGAALNRAHEELAQVRCSASRDVQGERQRERGRKRETCVCLGGCVMAMA